MTKNYNSITIIHEDDSLPLFEGNTSLLSPLPYDSLDTNKLNKNKSTNINPHPQDHLAPPFSADSTRRPSSQLVGTFNLIATIIGGGVLSLPIAFQKCGIFTTTLFMVASAYMTYMSLIALCYASRRCGGSSYGEVVRSAFGERMEEGVSWLLFVFLLFVIAAYMVLIRDIWTPLIGMMLKEENADDGLNGDRVLMGIIVVLLPFLFQRSLHALRWNCYIGFASILVLCVALCRGGFQRYYHYDQEGDQENDSAAVTTTTPAANTIEFFKKPTIQDVLFSFPIVMLAFLCHFNILSIQNTLNTPTRQRIKNVTGMAIIASCILMYFFGLGGYMLYGSSIQGNVLLNIPIAKIPNEDMEEYWLFLLGRIGCGTTLMLAMPLMALPCRDALLEVVDVLFHRSHHRSDVASSDASNDSLLWRILHKLNRNESIDDAAITTEDEVDEIVITDEVVDATTTPTTPAPERKSPLMHVSPRRNSILIRKDAIQRDWVFRNSMIHYGSTLMIVICCYIGATKVEGVAEIWSLIGSSLAFLIAFILPFGCFIVIENGVEGNDRHDGWIRAAVAMLVLSNVGAVVCTWNRFASM